MENQRQVSQHLDHLRECACSIEHVSFVVSLENQRSEIKHTVTQPRTVTHQMANGYRSVGRLGLVQRGRIRPQHTAVRKLGNKLLNRIIQLEATLLKQKKRRTGGHQLRI